MEQQQQRTQCQAGGGPCHPAACRDGALVTQVAVAAGGDEAVGDTLVGDRLLAATQSRFHAAFVDDRAEAWGCPLAPEAILVVATVHVGARAI